MSVVSGINIHPKADTPLRIDPLDIGYGPQFYITVGTEVHIHFKAIETVEAWMAQLEAGLAILKQESVDVA